LHFINDKTNIVTDALDGLVATSSGRLARLDGYPHIRVVVRTNWDKSKVALISGGGSGHEPTHAGFVGQGMLTAAVCGDVFCSPSVDAVLAAILAVTGEAGCLLIVKNYTGDRLNFGFAAERARGLGLKVNMVIVDDDIALPDVAQARGIAGTLLVHKIAGSLAQNGANLAQVSEAATRIIDGVKSLGMSLNSCHIPGGGEENRIPSGKAELGLGIHGEAGAEQIDYSHAADAMGKIVDKLQSLTTGDVPHVALLNNLGGTSVLEMQILARELLRSNLAGRIKYIIGPAPLMTSLSMHGFSVSLCPLGDEETAALLAETSASAWVAAQKVTDVHVLPLPEGLRPTKPVASSHPTTRRLIESVCTTLIESEADLNSLDAKVGDGDTGSTLAGGARALLSALDELPLADYAQLLRAIGLELGRTMGGSSGVLLAIFFTAAADVATSGEEIVTALKTGLARMQQIGGAKIGYRTMVDALAPSLDALPSGLQAAAQAARHGADSTAHLSKALAGRSTYLSEAQLKGYADPGAEAVARIFERLTKADK